MLYGVILNPNTMPSRHVAKFYDQYEGWMYGTMQRRKEDAIGVVTGIATMSFPSCTCPRA